MPCNKAFDLYIIDMPKVYFCVFRRACFYCVNYWLSVSFAVCVSVAGAHRIRLSRYLHARSHNESRRLRLRSASRFLSTQRMEYIGLFYRLRRVCDAFVTSFAEF